MAIKRITTNLIQDVSIGTIDIANNAITAAKITDGNITTAKLADLNVTAGKLAGTLDLTGKTITVATATTGDSDTSPASTAFVQQEIAALVDSSPDSLNTLNELAAALGDDASFSTTITNSIATKLPLAGGTLTGALTINSGTANTGLTITSTDAASWLTMTDPTASLFFGNTGGEFALWTGGSEAMRVDGSGNVGIGTTNASSMYSGASQLVVGSGTGDQGITIYAGNSSLSRLHFADGTSGNNQYAGFIAYAHNDDKLLIGTGADGGTDVTIDGGKVGIGTGSPLAILTSKNTGSLTTNSNDGDHTGFGLFLGKDTLSANTVNTAIGFGNTSSGRKYAAIGMQTYADVDQNGLNFYIQSTASGSSAALTEAMRIDSSGKVGIGETSPIALLHINGAGDAIRVTSTNTGAGGAQMDLLHYTSSPADNDIHGSINFGGYYSGSSSAYGSAIRSVWSNVGAKEAQLEFYTRDDSDFAARMVIDKDGKVGIGVSPSSEFHVKGDANTIARIEPNNNSGKATLLLSSTGSGDGGIQYDANSNLMHLFSYNYMTFNVGTGNLSGSYPANERMRITQDGKVGIGTVPSEMLHISGGGNGPEVRLQNSSSSHYIRAYNDNWNFLANSSNTAMTIKNSGQVNFGAGLGIGGTAAANTLDDYEEGTYNATISCASGSITLYTSYTALRYTKIGRQVHIHGKLAMSAVSSPSGATNLNLPFASANDTNRSGVANNIMTGFFNGSAVTNGIYPIYGNIEEASSNCRLFIMLPPVTNNIGDNHVAAGSDIHVNFTYTVQ